MVGRKSKVNLTPKVAEFKRCEKLERISLLDLAADD
jgi:hypothetical protein